MTSSTSKTIEFKDNSLSGDWIKTRTWDIHDEDPVARILSLGHEKMLRMGWDQKEYLRHYLLMPVAQGLPDEVYDQIIAFIEGDAVDTIEKAKKCAVCGKRHKKGEKYDHVCKGRLNWSPKDNWVDKVGGLPRYIEDIALALMRERGWPRSRAIPVAVNRVKLWAAGGGGVKADTRAKAAKAVAEWEAKKMKARATKDD